MQLGDDRKECCKQPENLVPRQERPDLLVNTCKICNCRHFELMVDPIKVFARGAQVGG